MRHGATILWAALATVAGTGLFMLKYQVQAEEQRLTHLRKEIVQTQEAIHVLKAEWSYLNEPSHLRELAERNLGMHPMKVSQLSSIDSFAMADKRPDDNAAPLSNPLAEDQTQTPPAATVSANPAPTPAPVMPVQPTAPVRSFDVKAVQPVHAPVAKPVQAAVKTVPAAKAPQVKTALAKPAAKPVQVAQATKQITVAQASKPAAAKPITVAQAAPAPKFKSSYPSYPTVSPTYAAYPSTAAAPTATPARSAGNVMVITSPALDAR